MIDPDLLSLKWKDFQENMRTEFGSLRESQDFTNVTLACEDGQQVEAHKVILAAASPFFCDLFRRNRHEYSMIFMRAVKSEDLIAIIDFVYYGEVNVPQDNLETFLALAQELKLKGLTQAETTEDSKEFIKSEKPVVDKSSVLSAKQDAPPNPDQLDQDELPATKKSEAKKTKKGPSKEKTEGEFPCPQCKKKYKTYNHLNTHKMREHEEKKYICEECDFQSSWLSHFLSHKQNKHEGK